MFLKNLKAQLKVNMKDKLLLISCLILSLFVFMSEAEATKYKNKKKAAKQKAELTEAISGIPIYRDKLEGDYEILGFVQGRDVLTKTKRSVIYQMRAKAYSVDADAIMEFRCEKTVKNMHQSCDGFAIKFKPGDPRYQSDQY